MAKKKSKTISEKHAKAARKNGKKGGRPTDYKKKYCEEIVKYFRDRPLVVTKRIGDRLVQEPNSLPFFQSFADKIGVSHETLLEWTRKDEKSKKTGIPCIYNGFSESYKKAKEYQKQFLITNAMNGLYNSTFAIFTAKNITDMRDKTVQDVHHTGEVTSNFKVNDDTFVKLANAISRKFNPKPKKSVDGKVDKGNKRQG